MSVFKQFGPGVPPRFTFVGFTSKGFRSFRWKIRINSAFKVYLTIGPDMRDKRVGCNGDITSRRGSVRSIEIKSSLRYETL